MISRLRGLEALRLVERLLGGDMDDEPAEKRKAATATVNLLDYLYDFEATYHYMPDPQMSWILFMEGVKRAHRYDARALLHSMTGTQWAIGAAFSKDGTWKLEQKRIADIAYPAAGQNGNKPKAKIILVDNPDQIDEVMKSKERDDAD